MKLINDRSPTIAVSGRITANSATAYSEVTSCSTTRNWLTLSGKISTGKSARRQEIGGRGGHPALKMSHARFSSLIHLEAKIEVPRHPPSGQPVIHGESS
jgi:hypothetical protein